MRLVVVPIPISSLPQLHSPFPTATPMEQAQTPAVTGGGPAPFLLKTYEMVDDCSTDDVVSWSSTNSSFVVWNPPEFSTRLLPTYFKHNNFSSFIRQLNTYGFHKIDPERWEFANDYFVKGKKDLLKNIYRRKPIHSHSQPPLSLADAERSALEEEIERLQREKTGLQADLWRFKQQQSGCRIQLQDLEKRLHDMEERQAKMVAFLHRAVQNPKFVENLLRMAISSASAQDLSALHRKRRLPGVAYGAEVGENSFCENSVSSSNSKPAEVGNAFGQDFCDKLKLELCTAISDSNLVSPSTQGSREEDQSPQGKLTTDGSRHIPVVPETLDLSDTGASFCPRKCLLLSELDNGDGLVSCHLNLTLASSSMQVESSNHLSRIPSSIDLDATIDIDQCSRQTSKEEDNCNIDGKNAIYLHGLTDSDVPSAKEVTPPGNQTPVPATGRANDRFWEQFLTERPGSSDTEEASSSLKEDACEEQEEMIMKDDRWRNIKDMEQLTL